ncbi:hypothetical protein NIES4075_08280 [Tolypothrix sp. NIES-4075]|uniref:DUF6816 family protein n=1 Tax=Tolypothrix sp. NIES-4075 TaxID=2005459 RepID=UPI000B5CB4C4|nr:hypothetical protein [Tolypothrix sp. NIES-4075]GAX39866.1 hypothetical protein NIES4075_08280 [Tolypothrix sp. NIES-4075]
MFAMKAILSVCLIFLFMLSGLEAAAGELSQQVPVLARAKDGKFADPKGQRLANFPQWEKITTVRSPEGDLIYPDWMAGNWQLKSTLIDLAAPLAPDIVTPGFEGNRRQLNQTVSFPVRFVKEQLPVSGLKLIPRIDKKLPVVVADRAFNSLNLARTYLGDRVLSVKVDPKSPNRQITLLKGNLQLVSIVTGRATETTPDNKFITTEVFQQLFKGGSNPYFNSVESTTAYRKLSTSNPVIEADQVTAVYLSPQDPDYFKAGSHPVALYRYRLEFFPSQVSATPKG